VKDILNDLEMLKNKMEIGNIERGLILNNEKASKVSYKKPRSSKKKFLASPTVQLNKLLPINQVYY
jgi:hypothetical protein